MWLCDKVEDKVMNAFVSNINAEKCWECESVKRWSGALVIDESRSKKKY